MLAALTVLAALVAWGAAPARAATTHVVVDGETLSSIAAANGLGAETLASWNGLALDGVLVSGTALSVPTPEEVGVSTTASTASASTGTVVGSHTVVYGESLSSIAAANGVTVADLAATNGLSETGILIEGQALQIPAATATTASAAPAAGLGAIPSPWGDLYLDPAAADAWNAMREQAMTDYGVDLHPAGPLSAYRTSDQQGEMYELFLSGAGAPANPPGYSSHEVGISVDLATAEMRWVVDQIGYLYGWGKFEAPDEWWHVSYGG